MADSLPWEAWCNTLICSCQVHTITGTGESASKELTSAHQREGAGVSVIKIRLPQGILKAVWILNATHLQDSALNADVLTYTSKVCSQEEVIAMMHIKDIYLFFPYLSKLSKSCCISKWVQTTAEDRNVNPPFKNRDLLYSDLPGWKCRTKWSISGIFSVSALLQYSTSFSLPSHPDWKRSCPNTLANTAFPTALCPTHSYFSSIKVLWSNLGKEGEPREKHSQVFFQKHWKAGVSKQNPARKRWEFTNLQVLMYSETWPILQNTALCF